jgi:hypothetical protein
LYGRTKLIFSSPLQIENYTQLKLLIMVEITEVNRGKLQIIEEVESNEKRFAVIFHLIPTKTFYVPLYVAYNCKLYTAPEQLKSTPGLIFDLRGYNLRLNDPSDVNFKPSGEQQQQQQHDEFQLVKILNMNVRSHKNVMPAMHANYRVALYSPVKILNCLPFTVRLDVDDRPDDKLLLGAGEVLNVHVSRERLQACTLNVADYLGASWVGVVDLTAFVAKPDGDGAGTAVGEVMKLELTVAPTNEMAITGKHLTVYLSFKKPNEFMLFSPYWLINKSGQQIKIRVSLSKY